MIDQLVTHMRKPTFSNFLVLEKYGRKKDVWKRHSRRRFDIKSKRQSLHITPSIKPAQTRDSSMTFRDIAGFRPPLKKSTEHRKSSTLGTDPNPPCRPLHSIDTARQLPKIISSTSSPTSHSSGSTLPPTSKSPHIISRAPTLDGRRKCSATGCDTTASSKTHLQRPNPDGANMGPSRGSHSYPAAPPVASGQIRAASRPRFRKLHSDDQTHLPFRMK
jgi:hypothetical protein